MAKKFGVDLDKVKTDLMLADLKRLKVDVPKGTDVPRLVGLLVSNYRKRFAEEKLAGCGECGGVFDAALEACPYCGDVDEGEGVVGPQAAKKDDAEGKSAKPPAVEAPPHPKAIANVADKVAGTSKSIATVPKVGVELAGLGPKDLDAAVVEIIKLKGSSAQSMYDLGTKLKDVHERQLWKLRVDKDGKPVYRSFEAFCTEEVKMSGTACYNMIDVVGKFTPKQISEIGHTKLVLALKAPEEDRDQLLKDAKSSSTKELQKTVKKLRAEKGKPKDARPAKKSNFGDSRATGKGRPSEHITIVNILGKKTIRLFKKPGPNSEKGAPAVPAKRLADFPYGVYDLPNGVRMLFVIGSDDKQQLFLKIETRRVKGSPE